MNPNTPDWLRSLQPLAHLLFGSPNVALDLRLGLTLLLCGAIGMERSRHERAAGFRPHILVGVAACVMTMAGSYGFSELKLPGQDPSRVAAAVVSGVGFLGAGAIIRHGITLRGLTTAATLWGSAGIGVAVGAGIGGVAVIATALILFTLTPLKRLEARLEPRDVVDDLVISLRDDKRAVGKTLDALERLGVRVRRATVEPGAGATAILSVNLAQPLRTDQMAQLARRLLSLKYIERVETLAYHVEDEVNLRMDGAGEAPTRGEQAALNLSDDRALDGLDDDHLQKASPLEE